QGRGLGSEGLQRAADYIAARFREAGLEAPDGHLHTWTETLPDGTEVALANVIGILPGTDPVLSRQPIVLGAHYDHLGTVEEAGQMQVYPGADDNASGVSILIEVASKLSQSFAPRRSIIFVAFTAEQPGPLRPRHFVANPPARFRAISILPTTNPGSSGR